MDSNILNSIGLEFFDPAYFIIGLLVICIILFIINMISLSKIKTINRKYDRFLRGKNAETLEDTILNRFEQVDALKTEDDKKTIQIQDINENMKITFQKVGIEKYDAFNEMGGKLSFSLAVLNNNDTGFVMNAMHSREGCYTYIKEIINGESYITLSEEEKQAIKKAISNE